MSIKGWAPPCRPISLAQTGRRNSPSKNSSHSNSDSKMKSYALRFVNSTRKRNFISSFFKDVHVTCTRYYQIICCNEMPILISFIGYHNWIKLVPVFFKNMWNGACKLINLWGVITKNLWIINFWNSLLVWQIWPTLWRKGENIWEGLRSNSPNIRWVSWPKEITHAEKS